MPIYALDGQAPDLPAAGRYWVAPDATLIGRVRLGEDVGIWFGSILRGDNEWISIGARSNVQEATVMHTDMGYPLEIGEDCTIGANCSISHALIGHHVAIAANSSIGGEGFGFVASCTGLTKISQLGRVVIGNCCVTVARRYEGELA